MRSPAFAALLVAALVAGAGVGYVAGYANERTVTATSTFVTTSTTTITSFGQAGAVKVANASVPSSAWSLSNPTVSFLQCGQAQTNGSGWITLTNTGSEPVNVTTLTIWLGSVNVTEYASIEHLGGQSCTVGPFGSFRFYFSFHGPTPVNCQPYTAYVAVSGVSNGYEIGLLGGVGCLP